MEAGLFSIGAYCDAEDRALDRKRVLAKLGLVECEEAQLNDHRLLIILDNCMPSQPLDLLPPTYRCSILFITKEKPPHQAIEVPPVTPVVIQKVERVLKETKLSNAESIRRAPANSALFKSYLDHVLEELHARERWLSNGNASYKWLLSPENVKLAFQLAKHFRESTYFDQMVSIDYDALHCWLSSSELAEEFSHYLEGTAQQESITAYYQLGRAHLDLGKAHSAKSLASELLHKEGVSELLKAKCKVLLASAIHFQGSNNAMAEWESLLCSPYATHTPWLRWRILHGLVQCYISQGDLKQAAKYFDLASEIQGLCPLYTAGFTKILSVHMHLFRKKYDEAHVLLSSIHHYLDQCSICNPRHELVLILKIYRAQVYEHQQEYRKAISCLLETLELYGIREVKGQAVQSIPNDRMVAEAFEGLARCYIRTKQFEDALRHAKVALHMDRGLGLPSLLALHLLTISCGSLKRLEMAKDFAGQAREEYLRMSTHVHNQDQLMQSTYAAVGFFNGFSRDSEIWFRRALEIDVKSMHHLAANYGLAMTLLKQGLVTEAKKFVDAAIQLFSMESIFPSSEDKDAFRRLLHRLLDEFASLIQHDNKAQARTYLTMLLWLSQKTEGTGLSRERLRKLADPALEYKLESAEWLYGDFRDCTRSQNDTEAARVAMHLGQIAMQCGNYAGAEHFRNLLGKLPSDDWGKFFLGATLLKEGKQDEAVAAFQEALKPGSFKNAAVHYGLWSALTQLGKLAEADDHHKKMEDLLKLVKSMFPSVHSKLSKEILRISVESCWELQLLCMTSNVNATHNLIMLEKELGLSNMGFDENNTCVLKINDELLLCLTYEANSENLYLYSPLLHSLPKDVKRKYALYEALLEGSILGKRMVGGGVGVETKEGRGRVLMHCALEMRHCRHTELSNFTPVFIQAVESWRMQAMLTVERQAASKGVSSSQKSPRNQTQSTVKRSEENQIIRHGIVDGAAFVKQIGNTLGSLCKSHASELWKTFEARGKYTTNQIKRVLEEWLERCFQDTVAKPIDSSEHLDQLFALIDLMAVLERELEHADNIGKDDFGLECAKRNLRQFGVEINRPNLEFKDNTCILGIDEFSLHLTYEPNEKKLYLYSPLLERLPCGLKTRLNLYERLLEISMLGSKTAGGGIGIAPQEDLVLMHCVLDMKAAMDDTLLQFVPLYIDTVKQLRNELSQFSDTLEERLDRCSKLIKQQHPAVRTFSYHIGKNEECSIALTTTDEIKEDEAKNIQNFIQSQLEPVRCNFLNMGVGCSGQLCLNDQEQCQCDWSTTLSPGYS